MNECWQWQGWQVQSNQSVRRIHCESERAESCWERAVLLNVTLRQPRRADGAGHLQRRGEDDSIQWRRRLSPVMMRAARVHQEREHLTWLPVGASSRNNDYKVFRFLIFRVPEWLLNPPHFQNFGGDPELLGCLSFWNCACPGKGPKHSWI